MRFTPMAEDLLTASSSRMKILGHGREAHLGPRMTKGERGLGEEGWGGGLVPTKLKMIYPSASAMMVRYWSWVGFTGAVALK